MQRPSAHHRRLPPARLLTILLVAVVIVLVPLLYANLLFSMLDDMENQKWGGADFTAYYTAARLIRNGKSPYDERAFWQEAEAFGFGHERPYIYFPLLAICIIPLTLLSPPCAATVWFCLNVALLGASTLLMILTLDLRKHGVGAVALLLAVLSYYPAVFSTFVGQSNALLLALLMLAWYLERRNSDALAGLAIAIASLVKVFPFLAALYFLWKGKRKLFLYAVGAAVVLTLASVMVVGLEPHLTYVGSVLPTQLAKPHPLNQSLSAFLARALQPYQPQTVALWRVLSVSMTGFVVLGTVLLIQRGSTSEEVTDLELSLVIVSTLLVSTVSWIGTLTLLVLPYCMVLNALLADGSWKYARVLSATAVLSFLAVNSQRAVETYIVVGSPGGTLPAFLLSIPMYGMILLWFTIAYLLLKRRKSPLFASQQS